VKVSKVRPGGCKRLKKPHLKTTPVRSRKPDLTQQYPYLKISLFVRVLFLLSMFVDNFDIIIL